MPNGFGKILISCRRTGGTLELVEIIFTPGVKGGIGEISNISTVRVFDETPRGGKLARLETSGVMGDIVMARTTSDYGGHGSEYLSPSGLITVDIDLNGIGSYFAFFTEDTIGIFSRNYAINIIHDFGGEGLYYSTLRGEDDLPIPCPCTFYPSPEYYKLGSENGSQNKSEVQIHTQVNRLRDRKGDEVGDCLTYPLVKDIVEYEGVGMCSYEGNKCTTFEEHDTYGLRPNCIYFENNNAFWYDETKALDYANVETVTHRGMIEIYYPDSIGYNWEYNTVVLYGEKGTVIDEKNMIYLQSDPSDLGISMTSFNFDARGEDIIFGYGQYVIVNKETGAIAKSNTSTRDFTVLGEMVLYASYDEDGIIYQKTKEEMKIL